MGYTILQLIQKNDRKTILYRMLALNLIEELHVILLNDLENMLKNSKAKGPKESADLFYDLETIELRRDRFKAA